MNNIQKVNKVYPNGWSVKSFPQVISDLNECYGDKHKGINVYYGISKEFSNTNNIPFGILITEQEYLDIVDDVDYDGVRFNYSGFSSTTYILNKNKDNKYIWGDCISSFDKDFIEKRFSSGAWIKLSPEPIIEPILKKTPLELIEERVTALEAAQVKPVVTEDWKNVACLSYNDFICVAKKCAQGWFYSNLEPYMQKLESIIKQKLSL